jgi:Putative lumazine-binding
MSYLRSLSALLLTLVALSSKAQSTEDSVKAAVNLLFTGMKNADAATIRRSFADSAILQTITANAAGKTVARLENVEDFADRVGKMTSGDADERISFGNVRVDGPLAIVWAPYSFFYKGKFSHCGVDSFQMLLVDGVWKIAYVIDTRRKNACPVGAPDAP